MGSLHINKYAYVSNNPLVASDPSGNFLFLALFIGSLFSESLIGASAAAIVSGIMSSMAIVELGKYNGDTEKMFNNESAGSLFGLAFLGAIGGWIGQAVKGATAGFYSGLSKGVATSLAGATGSAAGSVFITAGLDISYTMKVSGEDYANALLFGGLAGGTSGWASWYFKTSIATPIVGAANGGVMFYTSYVPETQK